MNQNNILSFQTIGPVLTGDVVLMNADGNIQKLGHIFGPYAGSTIDTTANTFTVPGHGLTNAGTVKYTAGGGVTCQLVTSTVRRFGVIDADTFQAIEVANTCAVNNGLGYAVGTATGITTDGSAANHASTGFAVGDNVWTADGQLVGAATAVGATSVTIGLGTLIALVDDQPLWKAGNMIAQGGDAHGFISQDAKENAIGVVIHDADKDKSELPAAVHLLNHGMFYAHADGANAISVGDAVGVKDNESLLYNTGTKRNVGFARDALASGTGIIRVVSTN
jgi:hypothetical protein